jgi:hypothetical protein
MAVSVAGAPNWERLWAFTPPTGDKAFDDWIAPQRTSAIGRILEAVKKPTGRIDLRTSEIDLATGIYRAFVEVSINLDPSESSQANNRLKKVRRILKAVQKQDVFVATDPYLSQRIKEASGIAPRPIVQLLFELQSLENELSWLAKQWERKADLPPGLKDRRPSELKWLAGVSLPLVYEGNFRRRAGRSRNADSGEPGGPTVRFIGATLEEVGFSYSHESIVRAMSRLVTLREDSKHEDS